MIDIQLHTPSNPVRFVTAASLFDGHDAAINIMRRILQSQGAEVIHLGHNRSVDEIVTAALQEDVQAVAVSSYQGGHIEFFKYLLTCLRAAGLDHVKVFGGGGGTITPSEVKELQSFGVSRIFTPEDGRDVGLPRMVNEMIRRADFAIDLEDEVLEPSLESDLEPGRRFGQLGRLGRTLTAIENAQISPAAMASIETVAATAGRKVPVLGITGTGGSGKSSLTDELLARFVFDDANERRIAVLAIDPTRRRGGALLGDRIRMNSVSSGNIFFRSLATRVPGQVVPESLDDLIAAAKAGGAELIVVETPGIGQGDTAIADHCDIALYVMTPEFGAASQLEKIDMLDLADVIAINKFDRRGGADAVREVRRQVMRNREDFTKSPEEMAVFGTVASRFNDDGVTALYQHLRKLLIDEGLVPSAGLLPSASSKLKLSTANTQIVPSARSGYLSEVAETLRAYRSETDRQVQAAREVQAIDVVRELWLERSEASQLDELGEAATTRLSPQSRLALDEWPSVVATYRSETVEGGAHKVSLSGTAVPRIALPSGDDLAPLLRFIRSENLPGRFPFTAGVFPFKRQSERPARMFAGEGDAAKTNQRFHLLSAGQPATRLSTAFDSVTLYGFDPTERPDIYGKVGNSGVSIATLDDMKALYSGFDLCDPGTSVSMTINGPAPTVLAMFMNTAIDQRIELFERVNGQTPTADELVTIRDDVLRKVRGTVQADILKEDQGQNTCIFSTEFSLKVMADIAEWFVEHEVRNFYSASISGYHIAEAGANPITQLAFTLANGFTYVEAYLARGLELDDFAPNLSFFFSNGMDPEYAVIGRVARRIWAVAMRDRYGANERSQKLKYHVQTSGRSLHSQEMAFNDIRTTLQALVAIYDNCNSLHTNAFDEAITTPTNDSVRRALAIQMVINEEWGVAANENPNQGSFIIDELTDLVEEAVLAEFDRISERGGVLGAMETGYQRGRIQDESMLYETRKHDGTLPIIGVNTFLAADSALGASERESSVLVAPELARSSDDEKQSQVKRVRAFVEANSSVSEEALARLQATALAGGNVFEELMETVKVASLGQITEALFAVGGRYRRNV